MSFSQIETTWVDADEIMTPAFIRGFEDKRAGRPFDVDRYGRVDQWSYERGRQFAVVWDGELLSRKKRRIRKCAAEAFMDDPDLL